MSNLKDLTRLPDWGSLVGYDTVTFFKEDSFNIPDMAERLELVPMVDGNTGEYKEVRGLTPQGFFCVSGRSLRWSGSIPKMLFDSNLMLAGLSDVREWRGRLSDLLGFDIGWAELRRLDTTVNIETCLHGIEYLPIFLDSSTMAYQAPYTHKGVVTGKVYSNDAKGSVCFKPYDKGLRERIANLRCLRLEYGVEKGLQSYIGGNVIKIHVGDLESEQFFENRVLDLKKRYFDIRKQKGRVVVMDATNATEQRELALVELVDRFGGLSGYLIHLDQQHKRGKIDRKNKSRMKSAAVAVVEKYSDTSLLDRAAEIDYKVGEVLKV